MDGNDNLYIVRISARVAVLLDGGASPDADTGWAIHGTTSDLGVLESNPELRDLGLRGGRVQISHLESHNTFWAETEFESPRVLAVGELELLKERTAGDWSDGVTAGFFEDLRDCLGLPIQVYRKSPPTFEQLPGDKPRFAPLSRLSIACWRGDCAEALAGIEAGDDVNARPDGLPVLYGAIIGGNVDVVRLLIERGADVRAQDVLNVRRCPLWTCLTRRFASDDTVQMARMLLERGANPGGAFWNDPLAVARRKKWDAMARLLEEFMMAPRGPDGAVLMFRAGDRVRICSDMFCGELGRVEQDTSPDVAIPAKVRIELFGREVVIDVPADLLVPLASPDSSRSAEPSVVAIRGS